MRGRLLDSDDVRHDSTAAQMDLSSRTSFDSILTWLDKQKIAGVLICIPKHDPIAAFVFAVINGCLDRDLPLVVEGSCKSPFWTNMSQLPDAQQAPLHFLDAVRHALAACVASQNLEH